MKNAENEEFRSIASIAIRHPLEIKRAHDMLNALVGTPELLETIMPDGRVRDGCLAALNTLCWVLGHPEKAFSENLARVEETLEKLGMLEFEFEDEDEDELNEPRPDQASPYACKPRAKRTN
jgi:hypothetical protein